MSVHDRIEMLAGAIALGEASDEERTEYRAHIAQCGRCRTGFGGEVEIARTMESIADARDQEHWQPRVDTAILARRSRRRIGRTALAGALAVVIAAVAGFVVRIPSTPAPQRVVAAAPAPVVYVALERRVPVRVHRAVSRPQPAIAHRVVAQRVPVRLIVEHNVVAIVRPAHRLAAIVKAPVKTVADVPIWRRAAPSHGVVARSETAVAPLALTADSMQIAPPVINEPEPIGGAAAISPQPPQIAYVEGMQGTVLFDVAVSVRGLPTRCSIVASSGYHTLDESVCRAAMSAHYTPQTVNGRATTGDFRDAFTFRISNDQ